MGAPQTVQSESGSKVWDFVFGSVLIGGAPLATYWLLATLLDWPCRLVYERYGDRPAFILQMITLGLSTLAAFAIFGYAVFWRTRHRLSPAWLLAFEIVVAFAGVTFFTLIIGVLIGPNDDWNR